MATSKKTVVLTINNNTNLVFAVVRSSGTPLITRGDTARAAIAKLLSAGFVEVSTFRGNTFTVVGYTPFTPLT